MSAKQVAGEQASRPGSLSGDNRRRVQVWLVAIIAAILVGWMLQAMKWVFVPLVFAGFIALAVAPVDNWVRNRVPDRLKWLGHVAAMILILVVLGLFLGGIWVAAQRVMAQFPQLSDQLQAAIPVVGEDGAAAGGSGTQQQDGADTQPQDQQTRQGLLGGLGEGIVGAGGQLGQTIIDYASQYATRILSSAGTILSALTLIFFFTLLMLIEAPVWHAKISRVLSDREERDWFNSIGMIAAKFRWFLLVRFAIGVLTAALYALWLWIFGVDLILVWALLTVLLTFIPTLGSLISGVLPVIYAFLTKDFFTAAMVGAGLLVIEQITGNYLDPRIQGHQLSLSSLVVLFSLVFWAWMWGVAGALLAVPMTIVIIIVLAHIDALRPFALMLSNERDMAGLDRATHRN